MSSRTTRLHSSSTSIAFDLINVSTLSNAYTSRIQHPAVNSPRDCVLWAQISLVNMAADMCVAVVKYSHATGVKSDNTIPWTHIVATNLFLVLKGEETHIQNGQLVLQVIQGNSALVRASKNRVYSMHSDEFHLGNDRYW